MYFGWKNHCTATTMRVWRLCGSEPRYGSPGEKEIGNSRPCANISNMALWMSTNQMQSGAPAFCAPGNWRRKSNRPGRSIRRTPGATVWCCWPIYTWRRPCPGRPLSSTPLTHPAGLLSGGTLSCPRPFKPGMVMCPCPKRRAWV